MGLSLTPPLYSQPNAMKSPSELIRNLTLIAAYLLLFTNQLPAQTRDRLIELEVHSKPNTPLTQQHQWLEALSQVQADRVTTKTVRAPKTSVEETSFAGSTVVLVKGVITNGKIKLPGKTFSITDTRGIENYLQALRVDGTKTTLAPKKAFGLTAEQLVGIHAKLASPVNVNTIEQKSGALINRWIGELPLPTQLAPAAQAAIKSDEAVGNNYQGLSIGTSLSIELRRHNLALRPSPKQGRGVGLEILPIRSAPESWPQGWPTEAAPITAFPKLFEVTALQLNNIQLDSVLNAIQRRLKIEFIVDPAAHDGVKVDLSKVKVTYNKKRSSYAAAISSILAQSRPQLRYEIRLDENNKPFIWINRF